jgi:acyl transferase domain-containing protein
VTDLFEPIAVIGMGARVPGAADLEQFWRVLVHGEETVSFPDEAQLLAAGVSRQELADPQYVKAVPLIPDVAGFDHDLFGMSQREAEVCDPQIRIFLEMTHAALENAGYDPYRTDGSVGVFGTTGANDYYHQHLAPRPDVATDAAALALMTSNNLDYLATLASYKLNLTGPSFTVLSACSSSLVALSLACQSLYLGECDMAVAGGSFVLFPYGQGYRWKPGSVLSRDGHCRALDAAASGTIFGSGAAAVVVKRLSDAIADRDHIRAVIRGAALNNDGALKSSFGAPSVTGQAAAIAEAMALAETAPADISYVEMHATGTPLGDPAEIAGLTRAYGECDGEPADPRSCLVGSVKSNVGHLGAVAGLASLIKVVLSLEREFLPPTVNFTEPNPRLGLAQTPFEVADSARPWPRSPGRPRRAGVSSFGIGGTNAHVILQEAPERATDRADGRPRIIVWSARTAEGERQQREALGRFFARLGEDEFADAVATLQRGRTQHARRGALACGGAADAARLLVSSGSGSAPADAGGGRRLVFAFPGLDAWPAAGARGLYGTVRPFTLELDELAERLEQAGTPVLKAWLEGEDAGLASAFLVQFALARTFRAWGLSPDAVTGVGSGQVAAAVTAGALGLDDAIEMLASGAAPRLGEPRISCWLAAGADGSPLGESRGGLTSAQALDAAVGRADRATVLVLPQDPAPVQPEPAADTITVPALAAGPGQGDDLALLAAAGRLWTAGHQVDWAALDPDRPFRRAVVPGYAYQRERTWVDAPATRPGIPPAGGPAAAPAPGETPVEPGQGQLAGAPTLAAVSWVQVPAAGQSAADHAEGGTALVLLPETDDDADLVLGAIRAAGYEPRPLRAEAPGETQDEALAAALREIADTGGGPALIVHAGAADQWAGTTSENVDEHLERSFWSLFRLIQRVSGELRTLPRTVVISRDSADVSGSEPLTRAKATLHGLVAAVRRESSARSCRLVDLGPRTSTARLAAELGVPEGPAVVALRGQRRWVRETVPAAVGPGPSPLRRDGHYLVTGGLGGLGLALARGLAETGLRPRLLLLRRQPMAPDGPETAALRELDGLGAVTRVAACDVADATGLGRIVDEAVRRDGPLHGVFHLAGVPGGGLLRARRREDALSVLRPKVHGTLALEEALREQPALDFVMLFSSQAGLQGLMGSADYCAASTFQDACATVSGFRTGRLITVDWPVWAQVGMAARSAVDVRQLIAGRVAAPGDRPGSAASLEWYRELAVASTWFLDEHRLDGVASAPGTALLDLLLEAARDLGACDLPVVVEDLTFSRLLLAERAVEVRVVLTEEGGGWTAELWFRPDPANADRPEAWTHSTRARLFPGAGGGTSRRVDLAAVREAPPALTRPPVRSRADRLSFGPHWEVIEAAWLEPGEKYARLVLPEALADDMDRYTLHPALLDMATGVLCHHRDEPFLPFTYRRIIVHDRLPHEFYSFVRIRQDGDRALAADLDLCTDDGRILVEVQGFTMVVSDAPDGKGAATASQPLPSPQGTAPGGLAPRDGVRLALDLLSCHMPAQVTVSTPGAPRPEEPVPASGPGMSPDDAASRLRQIWATVFGSGEVSDEDDFFALGGDSLQAVELLGLVQDIFGIELDAAVVFDAPTVTELAAVIAQRHQL